MGRHSRGAGAAPAPLPDPPTRHPYAPLSAEDTGARNRRTVDSGRDAPGFGPGPAGIGEPRYGATRADLVEPRSGVPAADPADSRFGARRPEDVREPRFAAPPAGSRFGPSTGEPRSRTEPRTSGSRAEIGQPGLGTDSRFGPSTGEPRFGATRADLARSRFGAAHGDSHLPAPGAGPVGSRLGGARRDIAGPSGSRPAAPAEQGRPPADAGEPQLGATRADLVEPRSGRRKMRAEPAAARADLAEPWSGAGRADLAEPRSGAIHADLRAPRYGATRADLAESVGSTALAPRPVPDPDEVTDSGARRARSTFRVASEAAPASDTADTVRAARTEDRDRHDETEPETEHETEHDEREPALLLQWGLFVAQTLTGAVAGLGVWLGFYRLWSTWPFYAAPAVGVAAVVLLVLARALRRRHGKDLDLLTAVVTVGVITVLTVLPAAFTLQGLTQ